MHPISQSSSASNPSDEGRKHVPGGKAEMCPLAATIIVRQQKDVRIIAVLPAYRKPGSKSTHPISLKQIPRDSRGTTTNVAGANLHDT
jgi:hypothetical protein